MIVRLLPEAQGDAIEAAIWYEEREPALGSEFLDLVHKAFAEIWTRADVASTMETYHGPHDVRRVMLQRFPFAVIAVVRPDKIIIVAVAHMRRRPLYWLNRMD